MRAAVIEAAGEPPRCASSPGRPAEPGAVLTIAVRAAPITPLDRLCAGGTSYFGRPAMPYVPGVQGVGTVEHGTDAIPAGTLVWFATSAGMAPGDGSMRERGRRAASATWCALPRRRRPGAGRRRSGCPRWPPGWR